MHLAVSNRQPIVKIKNSLEGILEVLEVLSQENLVNKGKNNFRNRSGIGNNKHFGTVSSRLYRWLIILFEHRGGGS